MAIPRKNQLRRWLLHGWRLGVFLFLIAMIHRQHGWFVAQRIGGLKEQLELGQVRPFYPDAESLSDWDPEHGGQNVLGPGGKLLGHVLQTSPEADRVIGFSGPTNSLVAFGADRRVLGVSILRSDDTREHAGDVRDDESFPASWNGLRRDEAGAPRQVEAVSGATLTSMAVADGIAVRLGGAATRSRFPEEIALEEVRALLPEARGLDPLEDRPGLLGVSDGGGRLIGYAARSSPHADHMIGYQGPTDVLIVLDPGLRVRGLALRGSYDNQPFVGYVGEDEYFLNTFKGFGLEDVARLDMVGAGIDGVSGATKTSVSVAEALIHTAAILGEARPAAQPEPRSAISLRDMGTCGVLLAALVIAFTPLRGSRRLRVAWQLVLVGYLGLVNGDMLSQALMVGWAQNGVAWRGAPGLVVLTAAALVAPVLTGRQVYCTHVCPFGAVQDWLNRVPLRVRVAGWLDRWLGALPFALLVLVVAVAMGHLPVGLVGIEPFDAFVFRVAGWATIAVAVAGLAASLFVNRAYCRYGCPTGAVLGFLRLGAASERFGRRDWAALVLAVVAVGMMWWR